jgi:hypothetical protein
MGQIIAQMRQRHALTPSLLLELAQKKLEYANKASQMERDALAADSQASQAKTKLVSASTEYAVLDRRLQELGGSD